MHIYQCETCGTTVEIEKFEAVFGFHEPFVFDQCEECFKKSLDASSLK